MVLRKPSLYKLSKDKKPLFQYVEQDPERVNLKLHAELPKNNQAKVLGTLKVVTTQHVKTGLLTNF